MPLPLYRLMQLTELERESILEERREQLQNFQNRQQLRQMMEQTSRESPAESEARPRRRTGKAKQLDELKRRRKVKSEREEKRSLKADGDGDEDDEEEEGEESEGESKAAKREFDYTDDEEDGQHSDTAPVQEDEQVTKEMLAQIVLKRGHLAKLWPAPIFEDMVAGAYVRMGVGQERGQPVYRLAQITGVAERKASKFYKLEQDMTDVKLVLAIGKDKRDFTMEMVSNSDVTDVSAISTMQSVQGIVYAAVLNPRLRVYVTAGVRPVFEDARQCRHQTADKVADRKEGEDASPATQVYTDRGTVIFCRDPFRKRSQSVSSLTVLILYPGGYQSDSCKEEGSKSSSRRKLPARPASPLQRARHRDASAQLRSRLEDQQPAGGVSGGLTSKDEGADAIEYGSEAGQWR